MRLSGFYTTLEEVVVVLKDASEERSLPIWVGLHDALCIFAGMKDIEPPIPGPLTHDLMTSLLQRLGVRVERVEICDLRENVYFSLIHLRNKNEVILMDARPSDAIALAVRTNAPIFVDEDLLVKCEPADPSGSVFD